MIKKKNKQNKKKTKKKKKKHVAEIIGINISYGSSDVPYTKEHGSKTNEAMD